MPKTLNKKFTGEHRHRYTALPLLQQKGATPPNEKSSTIKRYEQLTHAPRVHGLMKFTRQLIADTKEPQRVRELNNYKKEHDKQLFDKTITLLQEGIDDYLRQYFIAKDRKALANNLKKSLVAKQSENILNNLNAALVGSLREDLENHWFRSNKSRFRSMLWSYKKKILSLCSVEQLQNVVEQELANISNFLSVELKRTYYKAHPEFQATLQNLQQMLVSNNPDKLLNSLPLMQAILKHPQYNPSKLSNFYEINKYLICLAESVFPGFNIKQAQAVKAYTRINTILDKLTIAEPPHRFYFFGGRNYSLPLDHMFKAGLSLIPQSRRRYHTCQVLGQVRNCLAKEFGVTRIQASLDTNDKNLLKLEFALPIEGYERKPYSMTIKLDTDRNIYSISRWESKASIESLSSHRLI